MLSPTEKTVVADENERSVIINESQPLARCSVLYLGTAVPSIDRRGIDSVQEPLSKRYPIDGSDAVRGIEAWLSIDQNGLQIQFVSDPSVMLYYPIRSLVYCASVRFATRTEGEEPFPNGWRFVPLDLPDANLDENMQNPPLFAMTLHRTRELPMDECHCFVTKTKQIALELVEACSDAYQGTDSEQDCSKVPLYFKILNDGLQLKEIDDEISLVPALDDEPISDYPINNKSAGFFYKTEQVLIDYWRLWENPKNSLRRSSSSQSSSSSSTRSSHRPRRHRRLASITSVPESEKPSPQLMVDPYAPDPNVLRVERIQDPETGRDVFIRWLKDPTEPTPPPPPPPPPTTPAPNPNVVHVERIQDLETGRDILIRWLKDPAEPPPPPTTPAPNPNVLHVDRIQNLETGRDILIRWLKDPAEPPPPPPPPPTTPAPNYDFYIDFSTDNPSDGIQRLELTDRPPSTTTKHTKKSKKKKEKHRKHSKIPEHENTPTILPLIQTEFQMPSFVNVQPNWFYTM